MLLKLYMGLDICLYGNVQLNNVHTQNYSAKKKIEMCDSAKVRLTEKILCLYFANPSKININYRCRFANNRQPHGALCCC